MAGGYQNPPEGRTYGPLDPAAGVAAIMPPMTGVADFRSDTVTRPTAAMRRAMFEADVGDDVFGDDPSTLRLEARAARLLGKEAALFCPSGTMANQIAIRLHCAPGSEVLLHEGCHVYRFEQGGMAALHGVQAVPLPGGFGQVPVDLLRSHVRPRDDHLPRTRLLVIENTHNLCGGCPLPLEYVDEAAAFAKEAGIGVHMDGARLANASVALGIPMDRLARDADTATLCLSKGLGAPAGTILAGGASAILEARRIRKLLGGGMRQAGVLAAPALLALEEIGRLAGDHRRARDLHAGVRDLPYLESRPPETNLVVLALKTGDVRDLLAHLSGHGVRAVAFGPGRVRFALHRDLGDDDVERAIFALRSFSPLPGSQPA